jgi:hypothetical protein
MTNLQRLPICAQRLHVARTLFFVVAKTRGRVTLIDVKEDRSNNHSNPSDDGFGKLDSGMGMAKKEPATPSDESAGQHGNEPAEEGLLCALGLPGLPPLDLWAEEQFPADRELLRRYIKNDLAPDQVNYVLDMLSKHRHWHDVWGELLWD